MRNALRFRTDSELFVHPLFLEFETMSEEKKNEKKPDEIVRNEQVKVPVKGQFTVSLLQVNNKRYPNYRKTLREDHARELFISIKADGQLQGCGGSWNADASMIDLWGGFSRFEVMQRIALEKLVKEYNETMKLQSTDEGFIPLGGAGFGSQAIREKIREASPEWKAKYDAALASYKIKFDVEPVEDDNDAAMKGVGMNVYDKPPLSDLCAQVEALCSKEGITAGKVAKSLGTSDGMISHYRKINRLPSVMVKMFEDADYAKELGIADPVKQAAEKAVLLMAVGEFVKRLSLEQTDPCSISFSHARELANSVENKKEPMTVAGVARILKILVRVNSVGNLSGNATPEWTDFRTQLNDARKVGKLDAEAATAATAAAAVPPAAPGVTLSTLSKDQQEAIDKAAANATAAATPATPTVVTPNAPPATPLSAEEQAKQDALKAANVGDVAAEGAEDINLDDMLPTDEALSKLAGEGDEGIAPVAAPTPVGQLASKPKDAPENSRYKVKAPEKIERVARDVVNEACSGAENITVFDQSAFLFGAVQMFDCLGMDTESEACNESYANFTEQAVNYITALENFLKESKESDAVKAPILAQRPVLINPLAAKTSAAA